MTGHGTKYGKDAALPWNMFTYSLLYYSQYSNMTYEKLNQK